MYYTEAPVIDDTENGNVAALWKAAVASGQVEYRVDCPRCSKFKGDKTLSLNCSKGVGYCFRCECKPKKPFLTSESKFESSSHDIETAGVDPKKLARFNRIRDQSVEISAGDPVTEYLSNRLGGLPDQLPNLSYIVALKSYHEGVGYVDSPAMAGVLTNVNEKVVGFHTTAITLDGNKAYGKDSRRYASLHPLKGSAVRLYPASETLIVAEGIETALALHVASNEPAWACTSAALLKNFEPPPGIKTLLIAADNDKNGTGQKAANHLYQRLKSSIACVVLTPANEGTDWLDELRAEV